MFLSPEENKKDLTEIPEKITKESKHHTCKVDRSSF